MLTEQLPVLTRPGYDCRGDNANCPGCKRAPSDRGIFGGSYWFGVATTINGKRVALVLEVLGIHYPPTVPRSARAGQRPRGAVLVMHRESDAGEFCDFLGRKCETEPCGYGRAGEIYQAHGIDTIDPSLDLSAQPTSLWLALAEQLEAWTAQESNHGD